MDSLFIFRPNFKQLHEYQPYLHLNFELFVSFQVAIQNPEHFQSDLLKSFETKLVKHSDLNCFSNLEKSIVTDRNIKLHVQGMFVYITISFSDRHAKNSGRY